MKKLIKSDKQTIHFLEWIKKYLGWWHLICTPNDKHMNINIIYMLVKYLAEGQLLFLFTEADRGLILSTGFHFMESAATNPFADCGMTVYLV